MARKEAKHAVLWMAVSRAQCACGESFAIPIEESKCMNQMEAQDWLLDEHQKHADKFRALGL